jgi:hypothetical protein
MPDRPQRSTSAWSSAEDGTILTACASTRGPAFPSSRSTSARSASWRRWYPDAAEDGLRRALTATSRRCRSPPSPSDGPGPDDLGAIQRHLLPPQGGDARRRPRVRDRRGRESGACAATASSCPRPPARRVQPGQRGAGDGVGGGRLRRCPSSRPTRSPPQPVVAPNDTLTVHNRSLGGRGGRDRRWPPGRELAAGAALEVRFADDDRARLAQLPGATFYHRLREKFGRLAF